MSSTLKRMLLTGHVGRSGSSVRFSLRRGAESSGVGGRSEEDRVVSEQRFARGWAEFLTYRFEFYYTPDRTRILVYEDDLMNGSTTDLVTTLDITDSSYPAGAFAFFSNSQEQVAFGDFVLASLADFAADAGADRTSAAGAPLTLDGSATLAVPPFLCEWSDGTMTLMSTGCSVSVSPSIDTTYTLTVTDAFGRVATDAVAVDVSP